MPRQARTISPNGYYHVMMRGNGRQLIFNDGADRRAFLSMLADTLNKYPVKLIAWCLMDNHFHLLVECPLDSNGTDSLGAFMHQLATRYAVHFNTRTGHVGSVFQGRFTSKPIESDAYLLRAMRYIHNNPREMGIAPDQYRWSSYTEYAESPRLCDTSIILDMLGSAEGFRAFSASADGAYHFLTGKGLDARELAWEAHQVLEGMNPDSIKSLPPDERNRHLVTLRKSGFSIRQIERLTGIGRYLIDKVTSKR